MYGYIYKTTNLLNGKIYIGQHKSKVYDSKYIGSGLHLIRAVEKYGIENFSNEVIVWCKTRNEANEKEIFYINKYNARDLNIGYNIANGGGGGDIFSYLPKEKQDKLRNKISKANKNPSAETRKKLSDVAKGRKLSAETRAKLSKKLKGRTFTAETRRKISEAKKGYRHTEEARQKMSQVHKGMKLSDEQKRKLSESLKGHKAWNKGKHISEQTRQKISKSLSGDKNPMLGKHHTEEARRKISEAAKNRKYNPMQGRHHSPETKRIISEKAKERFRKKINLQNNI